MIVDNVTLTVKAGNGGDGSASFLRNGLTAKGGPDGGNGGNGGNILFQGSNNINDLREFRFKKKITADDGVKGGKQKLYGKNAAHTTILLPLGTKITDTESGKTWEIVDSGSPIIVARGGKGGRGNVEFKSATNQAPMYAEKGTPGEEKLLHLELKLIAEIGLIGLPNAGKSSMLTMLTNATPKIGDYPFTTLEPNIGMLGKYPIADIPGLIEGASEGRGLGSSFLKHIEKTKVLVHCISLSDEDAMGRYHTVRKEFEQFNHELLEKPELIVFTKTDLVDKETIAKNKKLFEKAGHHVITCSLLDDESIDVLKDTIMAMVKPK